MAVGQEKALEKLEERVKTLSSLMSTVQVNMQKFSESMGKIAELASRLGFMLAMMGGLPRSMGHGNLAMLLFSGLGKSRFQKARSSSGALSHQQQVVAEAQRMVGMSAPPDAPRISAPVPVAKVAEFETAKIAEVEYEKKQAAEPIPVSVEQINEEDQNKNLATRSPLEAVSMGTLSFLAKATKALQVQGLTPAARKNYSSGLSAVIERYGIDDSMSMKELHKQVIDELERRKKESGSASPLGALGAAGIAGVGLTLGPGAGIGLAGVLTAGAGLAAILKKYPGVFSKAWNSTKDFLNNFNKDFFSKFVGMDPEDFASLGKGKKTQAFVTEAARRAAGMFITTSSAGAAALQTGAPDAFGTLKGSVALVAAQFGQMLIPAAVDLSRGLQDVAKWFEELSPITKNVISEIFKWTLVLTAGTVILGKLVPVLNLLTGAVSLLYKALNVGGITSAVTRLGLFAGALGVAYLALSSWTESLSKAKEANREKLRQEVDEAHKKAIERIPQQEAVDLNYSNAVKTQLGLKTSASMQQVDDFVKSNFDLSISRLHDLKRARLASSDEARKEAYRQKEKAEDMFGTDVFSRGLQTFSPGHQESIALAQTNIAKWSKMADADLRESNVVQRLIDMLEGKAPLEKIPVREMTQNQKDILERRSGNAQQMLFSMSGLKATPQYNTIEELYKKINLSAVGQDPIEREMLRIQLESQRLFLEKMAKDEANSQIMRELAERQTKALENWGIDK